VHDATIIDIIIFTRGQVSEIAPPILASPKQRSEMKGGKN
jgi:hypothetical protein